MRTVHETEALRPSDPVPKHHSSNPQNKQQRIRLTLKGFGSANQNGNSDLIAKVEAPKSIKSNASAPASPKTAPTIPPADVDYENSNVLFLPPPLGSNQEPTRQFPPDIHFEAWELDLPPRTLLKTLKRQLQYVTDDNSTLQRELTALELRRKQEWTAKELVLENAMESTHALGLKKGSLNSQFADPTLVAEMKKDVAPALELKIEGDEALWWRKEDALKVADEIAPTSNV
jgi:hypothetical protein